jgi:hypothetical protein
MRLSLLALVPVLACTGCLGSALSDRMTHQAFTEMDLRYQQVMENLAMIAHEPSSLPVYSPLYAGTAQLQTQRSLGATTNLQHLVPPSPMEGFASQTLVPGFNRQLTEVWSVDPIVIPEKMEAMRCACQWVIFGPNNPFCKNPGILVSPDEVPPDGERHFDVAHRLERLPQGWLCKGKHRPPLGAAYKAHYGDTWVWVMPEGVQGLADFSLIMVDIARVETNSQALFAAHPLISPISVVSLDHSQGKNDFIPWRATVYVDESFNLAPDGPYERWRMDNTISTNAFLKTQITAAGLVPK